MSEKHKTSMNRRDFLKTAGLGALALAGAGGIYYSANRETEANRLLRDFPDEIPGAKSVDKYLIKGADKTVVHVRQMHLVEGINEGSQSWKEVESVQENIYDILSYLHSNNGLNSVYNESIVKDSMRVSNSMKNLEKASISIKQSTRRINIERINQLEAELNSEVSISISANYNFPDDEKGVEKYKANISQEILELKNELKQIDNDQGDNIANGAVRKLFHEDKIEILPVETMRGNIRASLVMERFENGEDVGIEEYKNIILEKREDIALDMISKGQNPLNVIVYGAAHWFGDNIDEWNKKHLDKKYSLIEITPENL